MAFLDELMPAIQPPVQQQTNPLADLLRQGLAQGQRAMERQEEEEDVGAMRHFLRGMVNKSATGALSGGDFDQMFRQSTSPARELLSNMLYGLSSSFTGQKYQTARQKAFNEFLAQQQMEQQQQQLEQRRQGQVLQAVTSMMEQRQRIQQQMELAAIQSEQNTRKRADDMAKFMLKYNQDAAQFAEKMALDERQSKIPKDPFFQFGREQAEAMLRAQGVDPTDPKNEADLMEMAATLGNQYHANRQMVTQMMKRRYAAPSQARPPRDRLQVQKITNAWGETEIGVFNTDAATFQYAPQHWRDIGNGAMPRDFTAADVSKMDSAEESARQIRRAASLALKSPDIVGSFSDAMPAEWKAAMGQDARIDWRNVNTLLKNSLSEKILAFSGAATSAQEAKRLSVGYPQMFEKPETFIPAAAALAATAEAAVIRKRASIDANDLDMSPVIDDYLGWLQKEITQRQKEKRPLSDIKLWTAEQFLEGAAIRNGYNLIRDHKGRIRGAEKK